jgi:hypothetical protein
MLRPIELPRGGVAYRFSPQDDLGVVVPALDAALESRGPDRPEDYRLRLISAGLGEALAANLPIRLELDPDQPADLAAALEDGAAFLDMPDRVTALNIATAIRERREYPPQS